MGVSSPIISCLNMLLAATSIYARDKMHGPSKMVVSYNAHLCIYNSSYGRANIKILDIKTKHDKNK